MNKKSGYTRRSVGMKALSFLLAAFLVIGLVPALAMGGTEERQVESSGQSNGQSLEQGEGDTGQGSDSTTPSEGEQESTASSSPSQPLSPAFSSLGSEMSTSGSIGTLSADGQLSITVDAYTTPTTQPAGFDNYIRLSSAVSNAPGGYVMIVPIISMGRDDVTSTKVANLYDTAVEYVGKNYDNTSRGFGGYDVAFTIPGTSITLDNALLIWVPTANGAGSFNDYRVRYTFPNGSTSNGDSLGIKAYISEAENVTNATRGSFLAGGGQNQSDQTLTFTATTNEQWSASKTATTQSMADFASVDYSLAQNSTLPTYKVSYTVQAATNMSSADKGRIKMSGLTISDTVSWTTPTGAASGAKPTSIVIKDGSTTIKTISAAEITSNPFTFSWSTNDVSTWTMVDGYYPNRNFTVEVNFDENQFLQLRNGSGLQSLATVNNQATVTTAPVKDYKGNNVTGATSAAAPAGELAFGWKQANPTLPSLILDKWLLISGVERAYTADLGNTYESGTSYVNGGNSRVQFSLTPVDPGDMTTAIGSAKTAFAQFAATGSATAQVGFGELEPGTYRLKETVGIPNFVNTADQLALSGAGLVVVVSAPDANGASTLSINGVDYTGRHYKVINETTLVGSLKIRTKAQQKLAYPTSYLQYDTVAATHANRLQIENAPAGVFTRGGTQDTIYNYVTFENVPVGNYKLKDFALAADNDGLILNGLVAGAIPNSTDESYTSGNIPDFAVSVSGTAQNEYTAYYDSDRGGLMAYKKFFDPAGNEDIFITAFSATYQLYSDANLTQRPAWAATDADAQFTITQNNNPAGGHDERMVMSKEVPQGTYYLKEISLTTTPSGEAAKYSLDISGSVKVTITAGSYSAMPVPADGSSSNARVDANGNLRNLSVYGEIAIKNFNNDGSLKGDANQRFTIFDGSLYWQINAGTGNAISSTSPLYNTVTTGILRGYVPAGTYTIAPAYAPTPADGIPAGQILAASSTSVTVTASTLSTPGSTASDGVTYVKGTGFANISSKQTAAFAWQNLPKIKGTKSRYVSASPVPGTTSNTWTNNAVQFTLWKLNGANYEKTSIVTNVNSLGEFVTPQLAVGKYILVESALHHATNYMPPAYITTFTGSSVSQVAAETAMTGTNNDNLIFEIQSTDLTDSGVVTIDRVGEVINVPLNTFVVTKVDSNGGAALNGAQFTLYSDSSCSTTVAGPTITAGTASGGAALGQATFSNLTPGTYYLKETAAPVGYSANPTVIQITINEFGWPSVDPSYSGGTASYRTAAGATVASNGLSGVTGSQNVTPITVGNVKRAEITFQKTAETDEFDSTGDKRLREPLPGAVFTIRDNSGYYWKVDSVTGQAMLSTFQFAEGTTPDTSVHFTSGAAGRFDIKGLDPSRQPYKVEELSAPSAPGGQTYELAKFEIGFNPIRLTPGDASSPIVGYEAKVLSDEGSAKERENEDGSLAYIEVINKIEPYKVHIAKLPVVSDATGNAKVDALPGENTGGGWATQLPGSGAKFEIYKKNTSGGWDLVCEMETGTGDNFPSNDAWSRDLPVGDYRLVEVGKPLFYTPTNPTVTDPTQPGANFYYVYEGDSSYYWDFDDEAGDWRQYAGNLDGTFTYEFTIEPKVDPDDSNTTTIIIGNTGRPGSGSGSMLLTRVISLFGEKDGYSMTSSGAYEFEGPLANVEFNIYPAYKDASGRYHTLPTVDDKPIGNFTSSSSDGTLEAGQFITNWIDIIQTYQYGEADWNTNSTSYENYSLNKTFIESKLGVNQTYFPEYRASAASAAMSDTVRVDWSRVSPSLRYQLANEILEWDVVIKEVSGLPSVYASGNHEAEFGFTLTRTAADTAWQVQYYGNGNSEDSTTPSGAAAKPFYLNNYRGQGYISLDKFNSAGTRLPAGNPATIELWRLDPSVINLLPTSGDISSMNPVARDELLAGATYYKNVTSNGGASPSAMTVVDALPGYYLAKEVTSPAGYNTFGSYATSFNGNLSDQTASYGRSGSFAEEDFFGPIIVFDADNNDINRTIVRVYDVPQPTLNLANYWNGSLQTSSDFTATYEIASTGGYGVTQKVSTGNGGGAAGALANLRDGDYTITLSAKAEPSGADNYMPNKTLYNGAGGSSKTLTFSVLNGVVMENSVKVDGITLGTSWSATGIRLVKTGAAVTGIDINHPSRAALIIMKRAVNTDGTTTDAAANNGAPAGLTSATFGVEKLVDSSWVAQSDITWTAASDALNGLRVSFAEGTYRITEKSLIQSTTPEVNRWKIDPKPVYIKIGEDGVVYLKNATDSAGSTVENALQTSSDAVTTAYFYNSSRYGKMQIKKLSATTGGFGTSDLQGAEFDVFADANRDGVPDTPTVVAHVTYSASPAGYFANLSADTLVTDSSDPDYGKYVGDYVVQETKAPVGSYALRTGYEKVRVYASTGPSALVNWAKVVDPPSTTLKVAKVTKYGAIGVSGQPGYIQAHKVKLGGIQMYLWKRIPGTTGLNASNFKLVGSAATALTPGGGVDTGEISFNITEEGEYRVTEALRADQQYVNLNDAYATTGFIFTGSETPADVNGIGLSGITLGTSEQEPFNYVYDAATGTLKIQTTNEDWNQAKEVPEDADLSNRLAVNNVFNGYVVVAQKFDARKGNLVVGNKPGATYALYATEADALADTNRIETRSDTDGVGYIFFTPGYTELASLDLWVREISAPNGYTLDPWYETPVTKVTVSKTQGTSTLVNPAIAEFEDGPLDAPVLGIDKDVKEGEQGYRTTESPSDPDRVDVASPLSTSGFSTVYTISPKANQQNYAPIYNYTVADTGFTFFGGASNGTPVVGPTYSFTQVVIGPSVAYASFAAQNADRNITTGVPSGASRVPVYARVNGGAWVQLSATAHTTISDLNGNNQNLSIEYTMNPSVTVPYVGTWFSAGTVEASVTFDQYISTATQPEIGKITNSVKVTGQKRSYSNSDLNNPTFSYTNITQANDSATILITNPDRPTMKMEKVAFAPTASDNPLFAGEQGRLKYRIKMTNDSAAGSGLDITNPAIIDYLDENLSLNSVESIKITRAGVTEDLTGDTGIGYTAVTPLVHRWTFEGFTLEPGDTIQIEISTNIAQIVSGGEVLNEAYGTSTNWLGALHTSSRYPAGASFIGSDMGAATPAGSSANSVWSGSLNTSAQEAWTKLTQVSGLSAADYGLFIRASDGGQTINSGGKVYIMKSVKVGDGSYTSSSDAVKLTLDSSDTVTYRLSLLNSQEESRTMANSMANLRIVDVIPFPGDARSTAWDTSLRTAWQLDTSSFVVKVNGQVVPAGQYSIITDTTALASGTDQANRLSAYKSMNSVAIGTNGTLSSNATSFMISFGNPIAASPTGDDYTDDSEFLLAPNDLIEVEYTMSWDPSVLASPTVIAGLYEDNNLKVATNDFEAYYNPLIDKNGTDVIVTADKTEQSASVSVELAAPRVTVSGAAFEDSDYDGLKDSGEPALANVPVSLWKKVGTADAVEVTTDADGIAYPSTVFATNASGAYSFANLESSYQTGITYEVRFGTPASGTDWIRSPQDQGSDDSLDSDAADDNATDPGYTGWFAAETNDAGTTNAAAISAINAGYYRLSSIQGWVWDDIDQDGVQDSAETQGREDVEVFLYDSLANAQAGSITVGSGGLVAKTTTAADGTYNFTGLRSGNYFLRFDKTNAETAAKFFKWSPIQQGGDSQFDSNPSPWDGTTFVSATPDYTIPTGDYAASVAITATAEAVAYNSTTQHVDAGLVPISKTINAYVWEDKDYNGTADTGEPALNGVEVTLEQSYQDGTWTEYATTVTTTSGYAEFTGPGNDDSGIVFGVDYRYRVKVEKKDSNYFYSPKTSTTPGVAGGDSDINTSGATVGYSDTFTEPTANIGSGQYQLGSISGKVWFDSNTDTLKNADGIQNDPPSTPNPVKITLLVENPAASGTYVKVSTVNTGYVDEVITTSSDATYTFTGLRSGNYKVQFDRVNLIAAQETYGWTSSNATIDLYDSDAAPLSPLSTIAETQPITVGYYTDDVAANKYTDGKLNAVDAGIFKKINTVSGKVWNDANYDGKQNDSEYFEGVKVELYCKLTSESTYTKVAETTTNSQGVYKFDNNGAGIDFSNDAWYYVKVSKPLPAADYVYTIKDVESNAADTIDSDVVASGATAGESDAFNAAVPNAVIDAGFYKVLQISGVVWFDENDNGLRDDLNGVLGTGGGAQNISISLTGTDDSGAAVNKTTTTVANGVYSFTGLKSGTYTLTFNDGLLSALRSYKWSVIDANSNTQDDFDSDVTGSVDRYSTTATKTSIVLGKVNSLTNIDAGIVPYVHARGFAWTDTNRDGIKDATEQYLDGVTVSLYSNESGSYAPVPGAQVATGAAGTTGYYEFDELLLNPDVNYKVVFANPSYATLRWSIPGTDHTATDLRGAHSENIYYYDEAHSSVKNLGIHEESWNAGLQPIPSYSVTYDPAGGTGAWGTSSSHTVTVQAGSKVASQNVSRTGYTFLGWYDGSTPWDFSNRVMPERNLTLVAQWALIPTYGVYYDANGGTGAVPAPDTGHYSGTTVNIPTSPVPSRTGYTFGGWSSSPTGTAALTSVTIGSSNIWLYAIWTPVPTYVVTYNANGGVGSQADGTAYYAGDTVTVLGQGSVSRTGYTFLGWSLTPDGTVLSSFTITGNTTLYAIWQENGGTTPTTPVVPPVDPTPPPTPTTPFEEIVSNIFGGDVPTVNLFGTDVPLAAIGYEAWALVNLILTITGALLAMLIIALYFVNRRKDEDEDEEEARRVRKAEAEARGEEYEEESEAKKKRLVWRIITAALAVVAIILFVITQDTYLPIVLLDQWTIFHVVIIAAEIVCMIMATRRKKVTGRNTEEEMDAAVQSLSGSNLQ